ncbi:hypothetical protein O181_025171 [Austropuccinia psidii MF-1]|uniref:Uncharacterized protein n=1 Tax=Austropuccinia psidii MF-1 TaxID=1389203 RepID=A0A9Q3GZA9_9BASI|nr:hypothetical protein [Austropuccinia psidii MF-1]
MNEVQESYDLFSCLNSTQTAQTPDMIQNHQSPNQQPNNINRTPFNLELSSSRAVFLIDGKIQVIEKQAALIRSSKSSSSEEYHVASIISPTNTPFVPIVASPPQSINPQFLLQAHPNYIPSPDTPLHSPPSMVSQSHGSDFPPIFTEEKQTHEENLPNKESPCSNPSAQSDHSNICESSINLPISNETPIHSRADFHQFSPIISAGGIKVTINTQEVQSTISTAQNAHTPCVQSSPHDT